MLDVDRRKHADNLDASNPLHKDDYSNDWEDYTLIDKIKDFFKKYKKHKKAKNDD